MKTLTANPDLFAQIADLAHANPIEAMFAMTAVLMAVCWKLKDAI